MPRPGLPCRFTWKDGRKVDYREGPSRLFHWQITSAMNAVPLEGRVLHWILADACTIHLDSGLVGARQKETEEDRRARIDDWKARKALQAEDRRAKSIKN